MKIGTTVSLIAALVALVLVIVGAPLVLAIAVALLGGVGGASLNKTRGDRGTAVGIR